MMRSALLPLMAACLFMLAASQVLHAEDESPPLAQQLAEIGVELAADEAAAVAAYDAAGDLGFSWPEVQRPDEEGAMKAVSSAEVIIGKIKEVAYDSRFITDNLWIMLATALVFIMHLGFATLETGLCRSKNAVNVLFKNTLVPCLGLLLYALIGFNLMYPGSWILDGVIPSVVLGISAGDLGDPANFLAQMTAGYAGYTWWTDFLFQGMFAATAMTIVSGCVAERIKLDSFLVFTIFYVGLVYPLVGSWHWGGGWLNAMGFADFAGSTLVHSVGGWGGLAGILVLGARAGKYGADGSVRPIIGHNMTLAVIGVFLLWFGWFGFNGGSVLDASPDVVSYVLTTTSLAAAAGGVAAAFTSTIIGHKPDLTMALNGILAGLVGITANADIASLMGSIIIGLVAGVFVYFAVVTFDRLRIDDPVGALSVHLVCGIFGTLACGIPFLMLPGQAANFGVQLTGVLAYGAVCFPAALVFWLLLKAVMGIRVSPEEEEEGLDAGEHGMHCYHDLEVR